MTMAVDELQIAYCREARRLRCAHGGQPGRMLRAIGAMSKRYDDLRGSVPRQAAKTVISRSVDESPRAIFSRIVSAELAGEVLNYSKRLSLLATARRLGIGRFEANLVIAEAQHRAVPIEKSLPADRGLPLGKIAIALVVELIVAIIAYRLLM